MQQCSKVTKILGFVKNSIENIENIMQINGLLTPGIICFVSVTISSKDIAEIKRVQREMTKTMKGLQRFLYEERLKDSDFREEISKRGHDKYIQNNEWCREEKMGACTYPFS